MASTVIGAGIVIEGEVESDEALVIHGTVRGKIESKETVGVEQGATVEADVTAREVTVAGSLTGNITAEGRVVLGTGARMVGDVKAARFTIQDGAQFKGHVDMDV